MRHRLVLAIALALVTVPCSAADVTVDFEDVTVVGELQVIPGGVYNGMSFVEAPTVGALHDLRFSRRFRRMFDSRLGH